MIPLNLPAFEYKLKKTDGKVCIFDVIRKKYVVLTPEEWVRQHFIHYMINHLGYPKALIRIESGLQYNQLRKRSDIILYDRQAMPWLIIECKSPDQKIGALTVQQVAVYNTTIKAKYVAMTNGVTHICYSTRVEDGGQTIILDQFPAFAQADSL